MMETGYKFRTFNAQIPVNAELESYAELVLEHGPRCRDCGWHHHKDECVMAPGEPCQLGGPHAVEGDEDYFNIINDAPAVKGMMGVENPLRPEGWSGKQFKLVKETLKRATREGW